MKIKKPYNFILTKKHPDKFFDLYTHEEFPYTEINKHPRWYKYEYDNNGNITYREDYNGSWTKWEYNQWRKLVYRENSDGDWHKWEYDADGNEIYYEDSNGEIINNRR